MPNCKTPAPTAATIDQRAKDRMAGAGSSCVAKRRQTITAIRVAVAPSGQAVAIQTVAQIRMVRNAPRAERRAMP
jgi:hypothetical protein